MVKKIKRKERRISVRVSEEEFIQVSQRAAESELSLSDYVRTVILTGRENKQRKKDQKEMIHQVARIGNNLNQIAKWANTRKSTLESGRVVKELVRIYAELIRCTSNF